MIPAWVGLMHNDYHAAIGEAMCPYCVDVMEAEDDGA